MRNITQPHNSSHLLTRVDPRVKLLVTIALLLMVLSAGNFLFPLAVAGLGLSVCLWLRVPTKLLLIRFAEPLLLALVVLLLKAFTGGGDNLATLDLGWWQPAISRTGLLEGVKVAARIGGAVSLVAALGFATPFTALLAALAWLRVPRSLIEVVIFAWRYLFVLADDAQVIHAAQRNRLGYVGLRRSWRSFGTLTGALVIKAFDSSQAMTVAMTQRGYDGTLPMMKHRPFQPAEVAAAGTVIWAMLLLWKI